MNSYSPLLAIVGWLFLCTFKVTAVSRPKARSFSRKQELCIPRVCGTRELITYRLAKQTAQKYTGKSWPSWNTSNVGISGTADSFTKQRPSALRQQLNWTMPPMLQNLLFPKLSEHRRMNEWYLRTRKTNDNLVPRAFSLASSQGTRPRKRDWTNEAIWVSQFLDLLREFLRAKTMLSSLSTWMFTDILRDFSSR